MHLLTHYNNSHVLENIIKNIYDQNYYLRRSDFKLGVFQGHLLPQQILPLLISALGFLLRARAKLPSRAERIVNLIFKAATVQILARRHETRFAFRRQILRVVACVQDFGLLLNYGYFH